MDSSHLQLFDQAGELTTAKNVSSDTPCHGNLFMAGGAIAVAVTVIGAHLVPS